MYYFSTSGNGELIYDVLSLVSSFLRTDLSLIDFMEKIRSVGGLHWGYLCRNLSFMSILLLVMMDQYVMIYHQFQENFT